MAYLVLVRHGMSEYNEKGLWAGWDDPEMTEEGKEEALHAGFAIKDIHFDFGYTSPFKRTKDTLQIILQTINQENLPIIKNSALNERNYGDFTTKNKWVIKKQIGEEDFLKLRRSWNYPIPNGESLKQVYERVVPYYLSNILPQLQQDKNIIISSSGNALRALVKYLNHISDEDITKLEIATGEVYIYKIDRNGMIIGREIRSSHPNTV